jgi:hypothetical protein
MNRVAKAVILSVAALTTVASTVELASAGDRHWRRHHVVKPWKKRVVVTGITAGVVAGTVIATRPRVIYREEPVIVDQAPIYDRETIYDDDTVYADPNEADNIGIYRDVVPEAEEYAAPAYDEGDEQAYEEDRIVGTENNYFPDRPQPRVERKSNEIAIDRKQATIGKQPKKNETVKEANAADLKPWSKAWKEWCAGRFSSFNPQNGTYLGYDQKRHFCKAG